MDTKLYDMIDEIRDAKGTIIVFVRRDDTEYGWKIFSRLSEKNIMDRVSLASSMGSFIAKILTGGGSLEELDWDERGDD